MSLCLLLTNCCHRSFNRTKYEKFRIQIGQDENSLRALDSFVNDIECHAIFMLPSGSDMFSCVTDVRSKPVPVFSMLVSVYRKIEKEDSCGL